MSSMSNSHRLRGENEETGHYWVRLPDVYDAQDSPYCMYVECARCELMLCDNGCHDSLANIRCENAWAIVHEGIRKIIVDGEVKYLWKTVYYGIFPSSYWWPVFELDGRLNEMYDVMRANRAMYSEYNEYSNLPWVFQVVG